MQKFINLFKLALGWPLSIIAVLFLIRYLLLNSSKINLSLKDIDPIYFTSGIICFSIYFLLRSIVWKKIIEYFGHKISFSENLYAWSFSEIKRYVPGNIWSFLSRTAFFSDRKVDKRKIFLALLYEFELVVIACAALSIFSIQFLFSQINLYILFSYVLILFVILVSLIFIFNTKLPLGKLSNFLPQFTPTKNSLLLIISVASFTFFGIGSYLTAASLFNLRTLSPILMTGFFNASLLIGYISFITPMGLGIREAVITIGLSPVLGAYDAAALAIFTRIVLIFSEMTFLSSVLYFTKQSLIWGFFKKFKFEIFLLLSIISYNIYFISTSFLRYDNYYTGRFDLGNMVQTVWNTSQGNLFLLTNPNGISEISRLAFHADFILILLAPFYIIWSDPRILLLIQTVILSLGAVFIFLISKELLKNKFISSVFAISYLLYPALEYVNLYDFHGIALATTFILGAFYFMLRNKYYLFVVFLILAGITKENVWIITAFFGLYISIFNKKRILGISIFIISSIIFYILVWHAIPNALGGQHFALSYYSDFGSTPEIIIKNVIFSPFSTIPKLFGNEQLDYIKQLFLPLGYLSIFSPILLLFTIPEFIINLLSSNKQLHQLYYQYSSPITPFIFISSIYGVRFLTSKIKEVGIQTWGILIITFTIFSSYLYGPLPFAKHSSLDMFNKPLSNRDDIDLFLNQIPNNASVSSTNNLGSHLSQRKDIYIVPMGINKADYVLFLLRDLDEFQYNQERIIATNMLSNLNYQMLFSKNNFVVFKKLP